MPQGGGWREFSSRYITAVCDWSNTCILHSAERQCKWAAGSLTRPDGSETRLHAALSPYVDHGTGRRHKIRFSDVVAGLLAIYHTVDKGHEFVVGSSATHQFVQVVVPDRKQASTNLAIGGDAHPAAMTAEGMGHGGDDANLTHAIIKNIAACGFAAIMGDFDQRPVFGHAAQNLVQRDHDIRGPDPVFFQRHELDETQHYAFFPGKPAEGDDLVFVEATHQDAVDLHRSQTGTLSSTNSRQHAVESVGNAGDAGKAVRVDGVHADRNAAQAGVLQRLRHLGKKMAVGSDSQVERPAM